MANTVRQDHYAAAELLVHSGEQAIDHEVVVEYLLAAIAHALLASAPTGASPMDNDR